MLVLHDPVELRVEDLLRATSSGSACWSSPAPRSSTPSASSWPRPARCAPPRTSPLQPQRRRVRQLQRSRVRQSSGWACWAIGGSTPSAASLPRPARCAPPRMSPMQPQRSRVEAASGCTTTCGRNKAELGNLHRARRLAQSTMAGAERQVGGLRRAGEFVIEICDGLRALWSNLSVVTAERRVARSSALLRGHPLTTPPLIRRRPPHTIPATYADLYLDSSATRLTPARWPRATLSQTDYSNLVTTLSSRATSGAAAAAHRSGSPAAAGTASSSAAARGRGTAAARPQAASAPRGRRPCTAAPSRTSAGLCSAGPPPAAAAAPPPAPPPPATAPAPAPSPPAAAAPPPPRRGAAAPRRRAAAPGRSAALAAVTSCRRRRRRARRRRRRRRRAPRRRRRPPAPRRRARRPAPPPGAPLRRRWRRRRRRGGQRWRSRRRRRPPRHAWRRRLHGHESWGASGCRRAPGQRRAADTRPVAAVPAAPWETRLAHGGAAARASKLFPGARHARQCPAARQVVVSRAAGCHHCVCRVRSGGLHASGAVRPNGRGGGAAANRTRQCARPVAMLALHGTAALRLASSVRTVHARRARSMPDSRHGWRCNKSGPSLVLYLPRQRPRRRYRVLRRLQRWQHSLVGCISVAGSAIIEDWHILRVRERAGGLVPAAQTTNVAWAFWASNRKLVGDKHVLGAQGHSIGKLPWTQTSK